MSRSHRQYPGPYPKAPAGMCRWCGLWVRDAAGGIARAARFCGPICRTHYQLRADPAKMRLHVFFRDGGKCAACGTVHPYLNGDWEADHVLPLMISFSDHTLWNPENVVVLCTSPCHHDKSGRDRRTYQKKYRNKVRRILNEMGD